MTFLYKLLTIAGLIVGIPMCFYGWSDYRWMIAGCGMLAWPALLGFTVLSGRKISLADPMNLFLLYVFTGTVLACFALGFHQSTRLDFMMAGRSREDFLPGSIWVVVSLALVGAGYAGCKRRMPVERYFPRGNNLSEKGMQIGMLIGLMLAMMATVSFIHSTGGLAAVGKKRALEVASGGETVMVAAGYTRMFASLSGTIMLVLLSYYLQRYRRIPMLIRFELLILFMATASLPFISSGRGEVLSLLIAIVMIYAGHRKIPGSTLAIYAAVVLIGFSAMSGLRSVQQGGGDQSFVNPLTAAAESGNGYSVVALAHITMGVPERMEYQLGSTLITWLTAPIPRSIWPGKPETSLGKRVKEEILQQATLKTGRPPGFVGEGYINFGWIGIITFAFALGYMLRLTANTFLPVMATSPFIPVTFFAVTNNISSMSNANLSQAIVRLAIDLMLIIISYILLQHIMARRLEPLLKRRHLKPQEPYMEVPR